FLSGVGARSSDIASTETPKSVMAGHSRPKDGVASLASDPAIHALPLRKKDVDARHKAGHDVEDTGGGSALYAESLKNNLRAEAKKHGFDGIGIARPNAAPLAGERLRQFLAEGAHGDMIWMEETAG